MSSGGVSNLLRDTQDHSFTVTRCRYCWSWEFAASVEVTGTESGTEATSLP